MFPSRPSSPTLAFLALPACLGLLAGCDRTSPPAGQAAAAEPAPARAEPAPGTQPTRRFGMSLATVPLGQSAHLRISLPSRPVPAVATLVVPNPAPVNHGLPPWADGVEVKLTFHGPEGPLSHFGGPLERWTWRDVSISRAAELRFEGPCLSGGPKVGGACGWPEGATELEIVVEAGAGGEAPDGQVVMTGQRP